MKKLTRQQARIYYFLKDRVNRWVPLNEIMDLRIAKYSARVSELRKMGYEIENKTVRIVDGVRHTAYRLVEPGQLEMF